MQRISAVCLSYQLRFIEQTPGFFTESVKTWKIFLRSAQTQRHLNFKRPQKKGARAIAFVYKRGTISKPKCVHRGPFHPCFSKRENPLAPTAFPDHYRSLHQCIKWPRTPPTSPLVVAMAKAGTVAACVQTSLRASALHPDKIEICLWGWSSQFEICWNVKAPSLIGGWAYPSEKYDNSSVGIIIPNWMESRKIHVPNHQPEPVQASWQCLLSQAFLLIAWKIRVNLRPVMTSMSSLTENGLGTLQVDPDRWISPDH